jgi:hypothetical protein
MTGASVKLRAFSVPSVVKAVSLTVPTKQGPPMWRASFERERVREKE